MYSFILRSNKTFQLTENSGSLKSFPKLCSTGSSIYPHIIPSVSHIIPRIVPFSFGSTEPNGIPLFIGVIINLNGTLEIINLETDKNTPFCLVFYPDFENAEKDQPILEEYCKTLQPMVICRDLSGFYLGSLKDSNVILFEQYTNNGFSQDCLMYKIISGYNEHTMQTDKYAIFNDVPICIRKKKFFNR
jgi:hypothetical protein